MLMIFKITRKLRIIIWVHQDKLVYSERVKKVKVGINRWSSNLSNVNNTNLCCYRKLGWIYRVREQLNGAQIKIGVIFRNKV
jgi:hypothetical protein